MDLNGYDSPLLRPIDLQPVLHADRQMWLLRDPMELSQTQLIFPPVLAQMLTHINGKRSIDQIHRLLCRDVGGDVPFSAVQDAFEQLDATYLLDNARSRSAIAAELAAFRAQAVRAPALAGRGYAADSAELHRQLDGYSNGIVADGQWAGRGIISPHIDYMRGGPVYAGVWQQARAAVKDADLVLIFGTDHNGGPASITLTKLPFATPFGILPTDEEVVDELAAAIGHDDAFALELNHRREHSIELSAVWFHHIRGANPCPVIPILCGSFYHLTPDGHPSDDAKLTAFITALRRATAGRRVLAVASVDLAHIGPAFDSGYRVDDAQRARITESDRRLQDAIASGARDAFYRQIARTRNADNVCGFSSIYMMLSYLGDTRGHVIDYQHCPADQHNTSLVSICGMLLE